MSSDTQPSPDGASSRAAPAASVKVELDLEDAPFLEEAEEAPHPPPEKKTPKETKEAAPV